MIKYSIVPHSICYLPTFYLPTYFSKNIGAIIHVCYSQSVSVWLYVQVLYPVVRGEKEENLPKDPALLTPYLRNHTSNSDGKNEFNSFMFLSLNRYKFIAQ
jgi:hypothetical protein